MQIRRFITILLLSIVGGGMLIAQTPPDTRYTLAFSDDFSSAPIDATKWNYRIDAKDYSAELPANISINSGYMNVNLRQQSFDGWSYTGGGIVSKPSFRYGYFQVQAKTTANPGWHTSFWVMEGNGSTTASLQQRTEIDDFEINSDSPSSINMGYNIWNNPPPTGSNPAYIASTHRCSGGNYSAGFNTSAGYHYYGFEWTETTVNFYIDNTLVCTESYPSTSGTHDLVNIWLASLGYSSDVSVANNPSPASYTNVSYYVRDYYIGNGEPGYAEYVNNGASGVSWNDSSLPGYSGLPSRFFSCSSSKGSTMWNPTILAAGSYDVQVWKLQASNSDPAAVYTVNYSGGSAQTTVNQTSGSSGWVDLGTYSFAAGAAGSVTLTPSGTDGYCARASMVKFVRQ